MGKATDTRQHVIYSLTVSFPTHSILGPESTLQVRKGHKAFITHGFNVMRSVPLIVQRPDIRFLMKITSSLWTQSKQIQNNTTMLSQLVIQVTHPSIYYVTPSFFMERILESHQLKLCMFLIS